MTQSSADLAKYIFTLVQERHYDSDLGPEEELGSVILDVDPTHLDAPERQILTLLRAAGILDDERSDDDDSPYQDDPENRTVTYRIDATPAIEVDTIEEAAEVLIQRNRWISDLRTSTATRSAPTEKEAEHLGLSYEGTAFRTGDRLYAESAAFTPGKLNRFEFTLDAEDFEGWEEDELAMDGDDGIPLLGDYIRPNGVTVLQGEESRINLDAIFPQSLQQVQPGDTVVFEAPRLGVLMAAVEAGEHTTWNPNRGWLSMDIADGFDVTLEPANPFALVRYLGVLLP